MIKTTVRINVEAITDAVRQSIPRILGYLVTAQRDLVVLVTPERTGFLKGSISVHVSDDPRFLGGMAYLLIGAVYWPFVLEYGSYLNFPERRIEPQRKISGAASKVLAQFEGVIVGEIARVEEQIRQTGGRAA